MYQKKKSIILMIGANYFSAFVGVAMATFILDPIPKTLYTMQWFIWLPIPIFYLVTIILEWPFTMLVFRKCERWFKRSFWASVLAQTVSYAFIVWWFCSSSEIGLYTHAQIDPTLSFIDNTNATLFYIEKDGHVYKQNLSSLYPEMIDDINSTNAQDRLYLAPSKQSGYWDLVVYRERFSSTTNVVLCACSTNGANSGGGWHGYNTNEVVGNNSNFGPAADLRSKYNRTWRASTAFWPTAGLTLRNIKTDENIVISFETPFLSWYFRNATVLPFDEIVFQLDDQQICIYDRVEGKIALLANGQGPVVIMNVLEDGRRDVKE